MSTLRRVIGGTALGAALLVGSPSAAPAAEGGDFGQMVAMCAKEHLGPRAGAPSVSCPCPEGTMTFANFAGMVAEMRASACTCEACC